MPFTEICIYQVKPQKTLEFEALMLEAKSLLENQEGLLLLRLIKSILGTTVYTTWQNAENALRTAIIGTIRDVNYSSTL